MADSGEAEGDGEGGMSETGNLQETTTDEVPAEEAVEAILLPEGTVSFHPEGVTEEEMASMQGVQLVGNNLVLMDGGVILGEASGAILVQEGMFVQSDDQLDDGSEHIIAYIPDTGSDHEALLASVEDDDGNTNDASVTLDEALDDNRTDLTGQSGSSVPNETEIVLTAVDHQQRVVHLETDETKLMDEGTDRAETVQEIPQQAVALETVVSAEQQETVDSEQQETVDSKVSHLEPVSSGMIQIDQSADGAGTSALDDAELLLIAMSNRQLEMSETCVADRSDQDRTVQEVPQQEQQLTSDLGDENQERELMLEESEAIDDLGGAPLSIDEERDVDADPDGQREPETEQQDPGHQNEEQEYQGAQQEQGQQQEDEVDDGDRRVHQVQAQELVDYVQEVAASGIARADGRQDHELQVVPDDSTDGCKTFVSENLHETSEVTGSSELYSNPNGASLGVQMVPSVNEDTTRNVMVVRPVTGSSRHQPMSAEVDNSEEAVLQVRDRGSATFADLLQAIESTGDASVPTSSMASSYVFQTLRPSASSSPAPDGEDHYEVCVAVADNDREASPRSAACSAAGSGAPSTITVPVTVGDCIQQIPIELADWSDLTQQNLVAVAEDGTTIPLTVIQTGTEVSLHPARDETGDEETEREQQAREVMDDDQLTAEVLQQLTVARDNRRMQDVTEATNHIEVINMHHSEDSLVLADGQELPEGIIHLVQSLEGFRGLQFRTGSLSSTSTAGDGSLGPYAVLDGSSITIQEQSILPDNPDEMTNVIHIPEDAYLSGQPIELQVLAVPGGRLLQHIPNRTAISQNSVAPTVSVQRRGASATRRPARRLRRGSIEAQQAVRSLGEPDFVRAQPAMTSRGRGAGGSGSVRGGSRGRLSGSRGGPRLSGRVRRMELQGRGTAAPEVIDNRQFFAINAPVDIEDESSREGRLLLRQTSSIAAGQEVQQQQQHQHKIQLSNSTPSVISPENMEALIQILQALPNTSKGQTIQIILQNGVPASHEVASKATSVGTDGEQVHVVRVPSAPSAAPLIKKTSDIAIQVSPEFIEDAHLQVLEAERQAAAAAKEGATDRTPVDQEVDGGTLVDGEAQVDGGVEADREEVEDGHVITPDEDVDYLMAVALGLRPESSDQSGGRKRRQSKKKPTTSKQIVTVEEQWVVDPKPGVSYYAVIDYLSEHEQDGISSASEMKRPEAPSSAFMEDHLELHSLSEESRGRSMLESTVDSSVVVSPFRRGGRYHVSCTTQTSATSGGATASGREDAPIDLPVIGNQQSVTLRERTFEQAQLEEQCLAEQPMPEVGRRYRRSSRSHRHLGAERLEHRCGYCEFESGDKILVVEHCISEHDDRPVKTLSLLPNMGGRTCPYCHQCFDHTEFFSHMRFAHNDVHPYKCGYCDFMGRDRNQIRHHIQKKHRLPMKVINLLDSGRRQDEGDLQGRRRIMTMSEGEESVYEYLTDEEEMDDNESDGGISGGAGGGSGLSGSRRGQLVCPECRKSFKTLKYLKTHIKIHQAHRYQCGYCDFISVMLHQVIRHCQKKHGDVDPKVLTKELEPDKNPIVSRDIDTVVQKVFSLNTRLPRDPDASKWMRKWFCPHCDYTCQFGASYRRHLRMHANVLPYKCNYCSFKGREKYYVRRHIHRMHNQLPMIVVENTPENCAGDTSSDEDFQEKGLRRKRRRRVKAAIHAVVPLDSMSDATFAQHFEKLPVGERGTHRANRTPNKDPSANAVHGQDQQEAAATGGDRSTAGRSRATGVPRLPRTKEWSGENVSDYILERDGDKIVCKMCGQKTLAKAFYKHARKHFRVKPFKCGYCNYMSIERAKIRVHNTLRHPNAPFRIEECHLASITPQDFMDLIGAEAATGDAAEDGGAAMVAQTQDGDMVSLMQQAASPPQFCCPLCQSAVDYDERSLREHFFAHYDYYPFKCSQCDFHATSEDKVSEHASMHGDTQVIVFQLEQDMPEGLEETIQQFLKQGEELLEQHRLAEMMLANGGATDGDQMASSISEQQQGDGGASGGGRESAATSTIAHLMVSLDKSSSAAPSSSSVSAIFQCPICDRCMNLHAVTVRRHLYSHYNYKPFKCGYCNFLGVSKANIKQHTVTHGSVVPKIEMTDETMPADLTNMLHHIQGVLNLTPETIEGAAVTTAATAVVDAEGRDATTVDLLQVEEEEEEEPVTAEGKIWKESLARGECPVCHQQQMDEDEGGASALYDHVLSHLGGAKSIQCGHCPQRFADRQEATVHVLGTHPDLEPQLIEAVVGDEDVVREGLLHYLRQKQQEAGVAEAGRQATEDEALVFGVAPKDGQPQQYEMVIISENGTVMDTMEVVAAASGDVVGVQQVDIKQVEQQEVMVNDDVVVMQAASASGATESSVTSDPASSASGHQPDADTNKEVGDAGDGSSAAVDKMDGADDDFDADIVTVEGVLLTRAFRSETEASSDDDVHDDDDDASSSRFSNHGGDGSSSEDGKVGGDDVLPTSPWVDFVNDVMNLFKQSGVSAQPKMAEGALPASVQQQQAVRQLPPTAVQRHQQEGDFQCEHCGRRFLKMCGLQVHINKVHKKEPGVAAELLACRYCNYFNKDAAAMKRHQKTNHPNRPVVIGDRLFSSDDDFTLLQVKPGASVLQAENDATAQEMQPEVTVLRAQSEVTVLPAQSEAAVLEVQPEVSVTVTVQRPALKRSAEAVGTTDSDGQEVPTKMARLDHSSSAVVEEMAEPMEQDEEDEEEETVENIAKMLLNSAPKQHRADVGHQPEEQQVPNDVNSTSREVAMVTTTEEVEKPLSTEGTGDTMSEVTVVTTLTTEQVEEPLVPESIGEGSMPQSIDERFTLRFSGESSTQSIVESSVSQSVVECLMSKPIGESSTPWSTDESSVPQSTGESSLPQSTGESSTPESTSESSVPQSVGESSLPQSTGESSLPQSVGESSVPQSISESFVPQSIGESSVPQSIVVSSMSQPVIESSTSQPVGESSTQSSGEAAGATSSDSEVISSGDPPGTKGRQPGNAAQMDVPEMSVVCQSGDDVSEDPSDGQRSICASAILELAQVQDGAVAMTVTSSEEVRDDDRQYGAEGVDVACSSKHLVSSSLEDGFPTGNDDLSNQPTSTELTSSSVEQTRSTGDTAGSETVTATSTADQVVDVVSNSDGTLEGLENLEECDENLPKILQILQLRPAKEAEKP